MSPPTPVEKAFSALRASTELRSPQNAPSLRLFRILRKAGQNLESELSPRDPKSICTKARDLDQYLPHWRTQVDKQVLSGNGAIDLSVELEACTEVVERAQAAIADLQAFIAEGVHDHKLAAEWHSKLKSTLLSALGRINREFAAPDHQKPDTSVESTASTGTQDTRPPVV